MLNSGVKVSQEQGRRRLPFLADGSVVGDYTPLFHYWEIARRKGREELIEKAMLISEDFRFLERIVEREKYSLHRLLNILEDYYTPRLDPGIAREALREAYGVDIWEEDARRRIARILAGWLIEASKQWGKIRFTGIRLPED